MVENRRFHAVFVSVATALCVTAAAAGAWAQPPVAKPQPPPKPPGTETTPPAGTRPAQPAAQPGTQPPATGTQPAAPATKGGPPVAKPTTPGSTTTAPGPATAAQPTSSTGTGTPAPAGGGTTAPAAARRPASQPASAAPAPAAPAPAAPASAARAAVPPPGPDQPPTEAYLGAPILPNAQYLGSYDAGGAGQRFFLFGTEQRFADVVAYYRTVLKQKGELVFDVPATHMFEVGRFREDQVAFPPGVTVKDYTMNGSPGLANPKFGATPAAFPTVIQIVPPATPLRR